MKPNRRFHVLLTVYVAMATELRKVPQFRKNPITKSCRNAAPSRTFYRHNANVNEAQTMPFLFWMPMIVMCGLWRAAEADVSALVLPQR
jgi:hypothetical protein